MTSPQPVLPVAADRIASWFFRLNGFTIIETHALHPDESGPQRAGFDLAGVRFHNRSQLVAPGAAPLDDFHEFARIRDKTQIILAEIKAGATPPTLDRAWLDPERGTTRRLLSALGPIRPSKVEQAVAGLSRDREWKNNELHVRLCAVGWTRDPGLGPAALITWEEVLRFLHARLLRYLEARADTSRWEEGEKLLLRSAGEFPGDPQAFVNRWIHAMGAP